MINKKNVIVLTAALSSIILILTGCSSHNEESKMTPTNTEQSQQEAPKISIDTGDIKLNELKPLDKLQVTSTTDSIQVKLTDHTTGKEVGGITNGGTWTKTEALHYDTAYTLVATSGDTTETYELYVIKPLTAEPTIGIDNGATVGVGQTVPIIFDAPVEDKVKAEQGITIETTPHVDGAFHWVNDKEVRWRPAEFFKTGTKVKVTVNNYGQYLGKDFFGGSPASSEYTIGDSHITIIDNTTKTATVTHNGKVVRTFQVSLGKPSDPTNNGIYMVGDRNPSMIMDSSTYGVPIDSPNGYRLKVDYATQLSYSGIYVHSAPWAAWALGNTNQSHGCINAMPEDAKWFLDNSQRGDIVIVKNADGPVLPVDDGLGDWNADLTTWDND